MIWKRARSKIPRTGRSGHVQSAGSSSKVGGDKNMLFSPRPMDAIISCYMHISFDIYRYAWMCKLFSNKNCCDTLAKICFRSFRKSLAVT